MTSLEIISARKNIQDYIDSLDMPKELKRLIIKELYIKTEKEACEEAIKEAKENENGI